MIYAILCAIQNQNIIDRSIKKSSFYFQYAYDILRLSLKQGRKRYDREKRERKKGRRRERELKVEGEREKER